MTWHPVLPATLTALVLALSACSPDGGGGTGDGTDTDPPPPVDEPAEPVAFDHHPPGDLVPGSGSGVTDAFVFVPGMRFPIEEFPSFANSQVWGAGGMNGPGGGQCDPVNYALPWRDNFCETRGYATPLCPSGTGHQGQDIRPPSCTKSAHWAVAAEPGTITAKGSYTVTLTADSGTVYRYLHLDMANLVVDVGSELARGERIGLVSNDFGGTTTTIHLHFEIKQNVELSGGGSSVTFVPPYTSLVDAYERLLAGTP
ncbi:MAG: M23 family metallopeptidase [Alphaproteobacteria bacterium]|nr:M23 family metallopeptidase [Alphaproteobacteria bacterium]